VSQVRGRLLVVEDDADVLEVLQDIARMTGYEVTSVAHPDLVIDVAGQVQPDLFLIDVMLPSRSGIEVAADLRAHGFAVTPMIGMSASPVMQRVAEGAHAFQAIVEKPFDLDALMATIARLLEARGETHSAAGEDIETRVLRVLARADEPLRFEDIEQRCGLITREGEKLVFHAVYRLVDAAEFPLVDVAGGRVRLTSAGRQYVQERLEPESEPER
jgi:DNA-binding response OmpR family regulator